LEVYKSRTLKDRVKNTRIKNSYGKRPESDIPPECQKTLDGWVLTENVASGDVPLYNAHCFAVCSIRSLKIKGVFIV